MQSRAPVLKRQYQPDDDIDGETQVGDRDAGQFGILAVQHDITVERTGLDADSGRVGQLEIAQVAGYHQAHENQQELKTAQHRFAGVSFVDRLVKVCIHRLLSGFNRNRAAA